MKKHRKISKKKKRTIKRKYGSSGNVSQIKEDAKQRRKYEHGGRVEAYTWGELL